MSGPATKPQSQQTAGYAEARSAWDAASLSPLWEATADKTEATPPAHWRWADVRPLLDKAIKFVSPADVERRVLNFSNPHVPKVAGRAPTTRIISAGLQTLLPGETARAHRHSIDALRFVLEGQGAVTVVDGKECPMSEGDLILTPGWTWHEHVHRGDAPIIWLDVLNGALHRFLGTARFEAGPANAMPATVPDAAFASAALLPESDAPQRPHSPLFRYPYAAAVAALAGAPIARDGARHVHYVDPMTGGPAIPMMDIRIVELAPGQATRNVRTSSSAICAVVEGDGESTIGTTGISWSARDVFTLPAGSWISHHSSRPARLFMVSDREVYRRLGLLEEEVAD